MRRTQESQAQYPDASSRVHHAQAQSNELAQRRPEAPPELRAPGRSRQLRYQQLCPTARATAYVCLSVAFGVPDIQPLCIRHCPTFCRREPQPSRCTRDCWGFGLLTIYGLWLCLGLGLGPAQRRIFTARA